MPCDQTPEDLKPLIPSPSADLCTAFLKFLFQYPVVNYKLWKCVFDENGNVNPDFAKAVSGTKAGDYIYSASSLARTDALLCDGSLKVIANYQDLFDAIGYTYSNPSETPAATLFRLPDHRARFPVGAGTGMDHNGGVVGPMPGTYALGDKGGQPNNDANNAGPHKHLFPLTISNTQSSCILRVGAPASTDPLSDPPMWGFENTADIPENTNPATDQHRASVADAGNSVHEDPSQPTHQILAYTSPAGGSGTGIDGNIPPFIGVFVYIKI